MNHCVQCSEPINYSQEFRAYVCNRAGCPNWGLLQTSVEEVPGDYQSSDTREQLKDKL